MQLLDIDRPVAISTPNGGSVQWNGDSKIPGTFGRTSSGALLGPLELGIPTDNTLTIDDLSFDAGEEASGFLLLGGAAAAVPAFEDEHTTRRGALAFIGAIAAAAWLATTTTADEGDDELVTLRVATLEVADADAPWSIRIMDLVDDVLPPTTEILVDQRSTRVGGVANADEAVYLRPDDGEVRIYVRDSLSRLSRLLAWARSHLPGDSSLTFRREFPDGKQASEFNGNEFIRLTEHPAIVNPVAESGTDRTTFEIGDETVPHIDDGETELGAWDLIGDALIYEVGENPPAEGEWSITTRLSFIQSLRA